MFQNFSVREVVDGVVFQRFQKRSGELTASLILVSELVLTTGGQKDMRSETMIGETRMKFPSSVSPNVSIETCGDCVIEFDSAMYIPVAVNSSSGGGVAAVKDDTLQG